MTPEQPQRPDGPAYVDQPAGTGTIRKVQWSAGAAAVAAVPASLLSYAAAGFVVEMVPFWQNAAAYESVALLIELALAGMFTGGSSWAAGYWARARGGEVGS